MYILEFTAQCLMLSGYMTGPGACWYMHIRQVKKEDRTGIQGGAFQEFLIRALLYTKSKRIKGPPLGLPPCQGRLLICMCLSYQGVGLPQCIHRWRFNPSSASRTRLIREHAQGLQSPGI
jgi:hypothetical protein